MKPPKKKSSPPRKAAPNLPVLLFQARISRPLDKYGMFWTDGNKGEVVSAICPEGTGLPGKKYCWESTGKAGASELAEAIERAEKIAKFEGRQYRLVSINYVTERGLKYVVEWVGG